MLGLICCCDVRVCLLLCWGFVCCRDVRVFICCCDVRVFICCCDVRLLVKTDLKRIVFFSVHTNGHLFNFSDVRV